MTEQLRNQIGLGVEYDEAMEVSMSEQEKLDWVSFAIQEALNGNMDELEQALEFVEELRDGGEHE